MIGLQHSSAAIFLCLNKTLHAEFYTTKNHLFKIAMPVQLEISYLKMAMPVQLEISYLKIAMPVQLEISYLKMAMPVRQAPP